MNIREEKQGEGKRDCKETKKKMLRGNEKRKSMQNLEMWLLAKSTFLESRASRNYSEKLQTI